MAEENHFALRLDLFGLEALSIPKRLFPIDASELDSHLIEVAAKHAPDIERFGSGAIETYAFGRDGGETLTIVATDSFPQGSIRLFRHYKLGEEASAAELLTLDRLDGAAILTYIFPQLDVLVVPAVPSAITPKDLQRLLRLADEGCTGMRLFKDVAPNRYVALLRFRTAIQAAEFARYRDGTPFSWVEPDTCHVLPLALFQIGVHGESGRLPADAFDLIKDAAYPVLTCELPTCPVCLERLDASASGIHTSICRHSFRCDCLARWSTRRCAVCRYAMVGEESREGVMDPTLLPRCESLCCEAIDNIWACLICGHCGCGRYRQGHARLHFEQTGHAFALEFATQRVWDYAGDGYVHRLTRSAEPRSKLVPIPLPRDPNTFDEQKAQDEAPEYFSQLMIAQLASQREHFVEELRRVHEDYDRQSEERGLKLAELQDSTKAWSEKAETLKRQDAQHERLASAMRARNEALKKELDEERAISEQLLRTRDGFEEALAAKDKEILALNEQIGDMMAHIQAQTAIAEMPLNEDVRQGTLVLKPAKTSKDRKRR